MPKKLFVFAAAVFAAMSLSTAVSADMGPKPQVTVIAENAPDCVYYIDLLQEYDGRSDDSSFVGIDTDEYDAKLLEKLWSLEDEGWYPALSGGTTTPFWGTLTPDENNRFVFGYFGTPEAYRVIMVTQTDVIVSDAHTRTTLQETVRFDCATGELVSDGVENFAASASRAGENIVWFLFTLLVTLLQTYVVTAVVEGLLLLAFRYKFAKNLWRTLLVNLVTNGLLDVFMLLFGGLNYYAMLFSAEAVIFAAEALVYTKLLVGHSKRRAVIYAICANAASLGIGFILMTFCREIFIL